MEQAAYARAMSDRSITDALDRAEAAMSLLEDAVMRVEKSQGDAGNVALRSEVRAVIGELDRLIGDDRG